MVPAVSMLVHLSCARVLICNSKAVSDVAARLHSTINAPTAGLICMQLHINTKLHMFMFWNSSSLFNTIVIKIVLITYSYEYSFPNKVRSWWSRRDSPHQTMSRRHLLLSRTQNRCLIVAAIKCSKPWNMWILKFGEIFCLHSLFESFILIFESQDDQWHLGLTNLWVNVFFFSDLGELRQLQHELRRHVTQVSARLIRQLKQRDRHVAKHNKNCDVITAILQASSLKRSEYQYFTLQYISNENYMKMFMYMIWAK